MRVILGINYAHADASAALILNGRLVAAVAEERLGRRLKNDPSLPINAIKFVLAEASLSFDDVTDIAFPRNANANLIAKGKHVFGNLGRASIKAAITHFARRNESKDIVDQISEQLGFNSVPAHIKVHYIEHHVAHIASAYYCCGDFSEATGLSYDASGDFVSVMIARCSKNTIVPLRRVYLPNSLGIFYTSMCQFIGFDAFGEEYKVMGLAPYGKDEYASQLKEVLSFNKQDLIVCNSKYIKSHHGGPSGVLSHKNRLHMDKFYSDRLPELLGLLPFKRSDQISQEQKNLACSTQKRFEQVLLELVQYAMDLVGSRNLVTAGGCALNGVANSRILRELNVSGHFIQPAASDDGTSLGAALAVKHMVYNDDSSSALHSPFLGPCSEEAAIQSLLENCPSKVRSFNSFDKTALETAKLLNQGLVVGWYQGRSEWGPRALGNRSILASPTHKDMKDIINKKIKRRESFRPFAPSVLEEDVGFFFEQAVSSPFMMHVVKFKDEMYEKFPSVVHVDGTGRVQTVTSDFNPKYYRLLQEIKKLTGFGILLNTSFNENEPIVSYAEEALDCFYRTDMDVLVLNNIIIAK